MKKLISIILAAVLCISLAACGNEVKKAEDAVTGMLDAVKTVNFDKIGDYANILSQDYDEDKLKEFKPVFDAISENFSYKILSTEQKDDNTVVVKTEITASDLSTFLGDYVQKASEYVMSNMSDLMTQKITQAEQEEKVQEIILESLENVDLSNTVTKEIDIKVVKDDDGKWKVRIDDTFAAAVSAALFSDAYQNLGNFADDIKSNLPEDTPEQIADAMKSMISPE